MLLLRAIYSSEIDPLIYENAKIPGLRIVNNKNLETLSITSLRIVFCGICTLH